MSYYKMIDVSDKLSSKRIAIAAGKIYVGEQVFNLIRNNQMIKGDPLRLAEIAAIMGAKQTSNLIPLCLHRHHRNHWPHRGRNGSVSRSNHWLTNHL